MTAQRVDVATIRRTLRVHRDRLLSLPNVRCVAIGRKVIERKPRPYLSIRVLVSRKRDLPPGASVPKRLRAIGKDGRPLGFYICTDVERAPERFRVLALRGGDSIVGRMRGTIALSYRSAGGRDLVLTNAHVVARPDSSAIGELVEGVGVVHRMLRVKTDRVNSCDAAVITPSVPSEFLVVGDPPVRVSGYGVLRPGAEGRFFYVSGASKITCSHPQSLESPVEIDYGEVSVSFDNVVILNVDTGTPTEGHSGSLLMRETSDGALACGLVFAGNTRHVLVDRVQDVMATLSTGAAAEDGKEEDVRIVFDG
jgi:hypothetical protein